MAKISKNEILKYIIVIENNLEEIKKLLVADMDISQVSTKKQQMLVDSPNTTPKASYE